MSTAPDRDRAVEAALRRQPDVPAPGPTASCLDAETLAAWWDAGLDAGAMAQAEAHVSNCARCQALVAVMARADADTPEEKPAGVDAAARPWWRGGSIRWMAPFAAGAAAALLWMVVPGQQTPGPEAPGSPVSSPQTSRPPASPEQAGDRQAPEQASGAAVAPAEPDMSARLSTPSSEAALQSAPQPATPSSETASQTAQAAPAPAPARAPEEAGQDTARRSEAADIAAKKPAEGETIIVTGTSPTVQTATAEVESLNRTAQDRPPVEIVSPDPAIRWRVLASGEVERTTDGGSTWRVVDTGAQFPVTTGAAPSANVCWLVGRNGLVLLTADGTTWQALPFPGTDDLVAVDAADAVTASVTTRDGRSLRTTDAGHTWTP